MDSPTQSLKSKTPENKQENNQAEELEEKEHNKKN